MTIVGALEIDLPQLEAGSSEPHEIRLIQTDSAATSPRLISRETLVVYVRHPEPHEGEEAPSAKGVLVEEAGGYVFYVELQPQFPVSVESASVVPEARSTSEILNLLNETNEMLDVSIRGLQQELARGDISIADELAGIARGGAPEATSDARALALEVLVAAEVPALARLAERLVAECLGSGDDDVQFTAVACASALPKAAQSRIAETVRGLLPSLPDDTREAADAFLRLI